MIFIFTLILACLIIGLVATAKNYEKTKPNIIYGMTGWFIAVVMWALLSIMIILQTAS